MLTVEKVLRLRTVPLFSGMDVRQLGSIAEVAEEVVHAAGSRILEKGDRGDCMLVVLDGVVRIHVGESELRILRERETFGEMSILDGRPRSASASAVTDCLLLRIDQASFQEILASNFRAALAVIRTLAGWIRELEEARLPAGTPAGREGRSDGTTRS